MRDNLKSKPKSAAYKEWEEMSKEESAWEVIRHICFLGNIICLIGFLVYLRSRINPMPKIKLVFMEFEATVNNDSTIQQSHIVSARWDLLIRVPKELIGEYMCLQGNLQASFLYKNVTLVTSSKQSYNILESDMPQLLKVSSVATEEYLSGAIGKEIMEAIKETNEFRFGSRLSLTDCREETEKGTMSYECDEATLRFKPSGPGQIRATTFGKHPTCIFNL